MIEDTHRFRLKVLFVIGLLFWGLLLARLVEIQIIRRPALADEARCNHDCRRSIPARRGDIVDRDREPIARTVTAFAVKFVPKEAGRPDEALSVLAAVLGEDPQPLWERASSDRPFLAGRNLILDDAQVKTLEALDGVQLETEHSRVYPQGSFGAHVVGFTNADHLGIEGAELEFEADLAGAPGWAVMARDAKGRGRALPGGFRREPVPGDRVVLTVDADCQAITEEELRQGVEEVEALAGQAIVMDPRTGDVVALANYPSFDPAAPGAVPWETLRNRCVTDFFEPGSTFKIVTLSALVHKGVVDPDMVVDAEMGSKSFDGFRIRDHHPYGLITFREAVEHSSNVVFAKMSYRLGAETLYQMARDMGVGCPTGIGLPGETAGLLRPPTEWSGRSLPTVAIGQEVGVSALQLANLVASVANGGTLMQPRIALGTQDAQGRWVRRFEPKALRRVLTQEEAARVTDYLTGVVERGTGTGARLEGLPIAGKTGTAQKAENGRYIPGKYVASFVGYAPASAPVVVVLVVIDEPHGRYYGGDVAAPVVRRILERMLTTQGIGLGQELAAWRATRDEEVRLASLARSDASDLVEDPVRRGGGGTR